MSGITHTLFTRFILASGSNILLVSTCYVSYCMVLVRRYAIGSGSTPGIEAKFLDAESLDKIGDGVRAIQTAIGQTASQELWAGETAAANNGGKAGVTDTFLDTFWCASPS